MTRDVASDPLVLSTQGVHRCGGNARSDSNSSTEFVAGSVLGATGDGTTGGGVCTVTSGAGTFATILSC
jgi:hypothetical protein